MNSSTSINKNQSFLEYMVMFLHQGYGVDEVLDILSLLSFQKDVQFFQEQLLSGIPLEDIIIDYYKNEGFQIYFSFFKNNFSLVEALEKSLDMSKRKKEMIQTFKKTLGYPCCLFLLTIVFCIFVVFFLLPQVESLFVSFEIEKTLFNQIIFMLFRAVPLLFILLCVVIMITGIYIYQIIKKRMYQSLDHIMAHSSLVSKAVKKYYSLKFAEYFNELIISGYALTEIIEILYHDIKDEDVKFIVYEIYRSLSSGVSLVESIQAFHYFEEDFKFFFALMNKNKREKNLNDYITFSMTQIQNYFQRLVRILVPAIYMFVGFFVVVVYLSIITPMMNIMTQI